MLPPLPRCSGWACSSLVSPSRDSLPRKGSPGRPAHRPFRGMLGVHSRCGLHTRAVTVIRDPLTEGFRHFVSSMPAPVASGWSESPGGVCTHWKAPPCHGAPPITVNNPSFEILPAGFSHSTAAKRVVPLVSAPFQTGQTQGPQDNSYQEFKLENLLFSTRSRMEIR